MPNGSNVYSSVTNFITKHNGSSVTGTIGLIGGTPGVSYTLGFNPVVVATDVNNISGITTKNVASSEVSPTISTSPIPCTLTSGSSSQKSCDITVSPNSSPTGTYAISMIATPLDNKSPPILLNTIPLIISDDISSQVAGNLGLILDLSNINIGESTTGHITLGGSTGIDNLIINIASSNTSAATVTPNTCVLSTITPSCPINITGVGARPTAVTISASAAGYSTATSTVTVASNIVFGNLSLSLSPSDITLGESSIATVTLESSTNVTNLLININTESNVTLSANSCLITSSLSKTCSVAVTTLPQVGTYTITAQNNNYPNNAVATLTVLAPQKKVGVPLNPISTSSLYFGTKLGSFYNRSTLVPTYTGVPIDNGSISAISIDSSSGNIYAGTSVGTVWLLGTDKIWRNLATPNRDLGRISAISTQNGILYVATSIGDVFKFANGAWTQLPNIVLIPGQLSLIVGNNNLYGIGQDGYIYKFINGEWKSLGSPTATAIIPGVIGSVTSIAMSSTGVLYAGTNSGLYFFNGLNWTHITDMSQPISAMKNDTNNNLYIGTMGGEVWKYSLSNSSTTYLGQADGSPIVSMAVDNASSLYVVTNSGSVFNFSNNLWHNLGIPIISSPTPQPIANEPGGPPIAIDNTGNIYAGTTNGFVVQTTPPSLWQIIRNPDQHSVSSIIATTQGNVFANVSGSLWMSSTPTQAITAPDNAAVASITADNLGNIYFDTLKNDLYQVATPQAIFWGSFTNLPSSIAADNNFNIYADGDNTLWQLDNTQTVRSFQKPQNASEISLVTRNIWGSIYIATTDGSIYTFSNQVWGPIPIGSFNTTITSMFIDNTSNVYAISTDGKILEIDSSGILHNIFVPQIPSAITVDVSGHLFIGTTAGNLFEYFGNTLTDIGSPDRSAINCLSVDDRNQVYAGTQAGSIVMLNNRDISNWNQVGGKVTVDGSPIITLSRDNNGFIYMGTGAKNMWGFNGSDWQILSTEFSDITAIVTDTSSTSAGQTAPIGGGGASPAPIARLSVEVPNNGVQQPIALTATNIYIGHSDGSIKYLTKAPLASASGLTPPTYFTVPDNAPINSLLDNNGTLYVGTALGNVFRLTTTAWSDLSLPANSGGVSSMVMDSTSNLYVGELNGSIYRLSGNQWSNLNMPNNGPISCVTLDNNNNLYVATTTGYVSKFSAGVWTNLGQASQSSITSLLVDNYGNINISTTSGFIYELTPSNNTWINLNYGDGTPIFAMISGI